MKITDIYLENYRGFTELELSLEGKTAIIVGGNGAGKSTILNGATSIISRLVEKISYGVVKRVGLKEEDIKNGKQRFIIKCDLEYQDMQGSIKLIKPRIKTPRLNNKSLITDNTKHIVEYIKDKIENEEELDLPTFVHYTVHRNVIDIPLRIKNKHEFDQFSTYLNCFSSGTDFRTFFEWFRNQEDLENEIKLENNLSFKDKELECVRNAIYSFMPGFSDIKIMRKGKMRMVISKNDQRLEINQLSDGEKCTLAMIGDLARRLSLANPNSENPLDGEGIVFIDEIELHLHPEWQRMIINQLQNVFPNIQFIISTHSPQVLGEVKNAKIFTVRRDLEHNTFKVENFNNLFGKDSNLILEEYMDANSKNTEVKDQLEKLYSMISDLNIDEAEVLLNYLSGIIGKEDPSLIKAELILKRKKHLKK